MIVLFRSRVARDRVGSDNKIPPSTIINESLKIPIIVVSTIIGGQIYFNTHQNLRPDIKIDSTVFYVILAGIVTLVEGEELLDFLIGEILTCGLKIRFVDFNIHCLGSLISDFEYFINLSACLSVHPLTVADESQPYAPLD